MRTEQIREEQRILAEAFEAWRSTYAITNPAPRKLALQQFEEDWWRTNKYVWQSIVWALGLYVAARTGWGIHNANVSEGFNQYLSIAITVMAVWGIEGFITNFGFHRPRQLEVKGLALFAEKSLGWASLLVGLIISAAAGMEVSMNVALQMKAVWGGTVDQILSIALGVGLTFVLFGISEFIGRLKWVNEHKPLIAEHEHQIKLQEYRDVIRDEWKKSAVYLELMGEKEIARARAKYDIENATFKRRDVLRAKAEAEKASVEPSGQPSSPAPIEASIEAAVDAPKAYPGYKTDLVKEYLSEKASPSHSPTIAEIKDWARETYNIGLSSGTISTARREWYNEFDAFRGREETPPQA